jgi:hypothetical protein
MAIKTFRHRETGQIRKLNDEDKLRIAALEKLGYEEFTKKDLDEVGLAVTYEQVSRADVPKEPPALPKLSKPIPPGPTRDLSVPQQEKSAPGITREDVQPLSKGDK